jgi:DNA-binding response OmpR family regulator
MTPKRALVVDDSEDMREFIKTALPDFVFDACATLECAFRFIASNTYDLIVLDPALEDSPAQNTIAQLAGFIALAGDASVLVITGHPTALKDKPIPADALLLKPFKPDQLDAAVALAAANNSPTKTRPLTTLLLAATRAALGPAAFAFRHATV